MGRFRATLLVAGLAVVLAAGCGDDESATDDDVTTTSADTTTTTTTTPSDGELPGEEVDFFFQVGDELAVVGVEAGDTLNVRAGPSVDFDVIDELEPVAVGVAPTGRHRTVGEAGIWAEVRTDAGTGWVNTAFLAYLGATDDVTAQVAGDPAEVPEGETMLELGDAVAATRFVADRSDGPMPDVVVVDGPSVGDLGEITIDIVGLPDDAVLGERLHVLARPARHGEGFTVRTVERTVLCRRGVSDDGLCL